MKKCPIKALKEAILQDGRFKENELTTLEQQVETVIQEAVQFAADSPYPDASEAFTDVFA